MRKIIYNNIIIMIFFTDLNNKKSGQIGVILDNGVVIYIEGSNEGSNTYIYDNYMNFDKQFYFKHLRDLEISFIDKPKNCYIRIECIISNYSGDVEKYEKIGNAVYINNYLIIILYNIWDSNNTFLKFLGSIRENCSYSNNIYACKLHKDKFYKFKWPFEGYCRMILKKQYLIYLEDEYRFKLKKKKKQSCYSFLKKLFISEKIIDKHVGNALESKNAILESKNTIKDTCHICLEETDIYKICCTKLCHNCLKLYENKCYICKKSNYFAPPVIEKKIF